MQCKWQILRIAGAFGAALLFLVGAAAQPPSVGKTGPDDQKKEGPREAPAKADPALDAWVKVLIDKIVDKNDTVRDSARAALVAIGQPALPALKKLSEADDAGAVNAAQRVIAQIEGVASRGLGGRGNRGFPDTQPKRPSGRGGLRGPDGRGPDDLPNAQPQADPAALLLLMPALKDLELTAKQQTRVTELSAKHDKKVRNLFDEAATSKQRPDFEALGKLLAESMKELKGVLTEEQFKKLEKAMTQPGVGGAERRRGEF